MRKNRLISTVNLSIGYSHGRDEQVVKSGINLDVSSGELVCILGPNGCGKSTLLRTLANLQKPLAGAIYLNGAPLYKYGKELAKEISVVLTDRIEIGTLSVFEVVALGRFPYTNWMGTLSASDYKHIETALEQVHMLEHKHKQIGELSDGEQQRIMLAKALAQDTHIILLDEPTAHLDLPNRVAMMHLLRDLALITQKCIVLSTHELDLALHVADVLWLIDERFPIVTGTPEDLVLQGMFEMIFEQDKLKFDRNTGIFKVKECYKPLVSVRGEGVAFYWTKRLLDRLRIGWSEDLLLELPIEINVEAEYTWTIRTLTTSRTFHSISELIQGLNSMDIG